MESLHVYKAISAVTAELAKEGIAKESRNQQQGYQFRGIDDVFNSLSPLISANNLCILPKCLKRTVSEKQTGNGKPLFYVVIKVEFEFVSSVDGSKHTVVTYGEAMDMADKATNKAMSAAYKYACLQAFCIPTEGDNDADASTHEVSAKKQAPKQAAFISEKQVGEIIDLLSATDTLEEGFCTYLKVEKIEKIPADWFEKVKGLLVKKLSSMKKVEEVENV